jgi:hypothetical protein
MNHSKIVMWLLFLCIISIWLSTSAITAPLNTYGLAPAIYQAELKPGKSAAFDLTVVNQTAKATTFRMYITGVGMDQYGGMIYPDENGLFSAAHWIELSNLSTSSTLNVDPNNSKLIKVSIQVPSGTKPGQYLTCVFAEPTTINTVKENNTELQTKIRIGTIVKITVPGPESAFSIKCTALNPDVIMPNKERIQALSRIVNILEQDLEVTDSIASEVTNYVNNSGSFFDYKTYQQMLKEQKQDIAKQIMDFLRQDIMQESALKVEATLKTDARTTIAAKGEAFVYQIVDNGATKVKRLRDHFTLTPAGSDIKDQCSILPGGSRSFQGQVQRPLPHGDYTVETRFSYIGEGSKTVRMVSSNADFKVSEQMELEQKDMLVLYVDPEVMTFNVVPGEFQSQAIKIENLDLVEPIEIKLASDNEWLEINPKSVIISPGRTATIRVTAKVPKSENITDKQCKIFITPNRGKIVWLDIKVKDKRKVSE